MHEEKSKNYFIVSSDSCDASKLKKLLSGTKFDVVTDTPARAIVFWEEEDIKELFDEYDPQCTLPHGHTDYRSVLNAAEEDLLSEQIEAGRDYLETFVEKYTSARLCDALESGKIDIDDEGRIIWYSTNRVDALRKEGGG